MVRAAAVKPAVPTPEEAEARERLRHHRTIIADALKAVFLLNAGSLTLLATFVGSYHRADALFRVEGHLVIAAGELFVMAILCAIGAVLLSADRVKGTSDLVLDAGLQRRPKMRVATRMAVGVAGLMAKALLYLAIVGWGAGAWLVLQSLIPARLP